LKRHINSPYKMNWKMYGLIGGISVLIMIIAVICNDNTGSLISDIVKNLAFGCVASTIIALLIEIGNIKEQNDKATSVYDAVYMDLKFQISWYVETWARLCSVAFKDEDYRQEKHTWIEWYEITKSKFAECDDNRQAELMQFFTEQLMDSIEGIEKALKQIDSQQYILNINGIYDEGLRKILGDYSFEFYAAKLTLRREYDKADFWKSFDAIKQDLINYIYNWVDIRYYNYCRFKPYKFHDDKSETMRAMMESENK
jgi:hypothetical protein